MSQGYYIVDSFIRPGVYGSFSVWAESEDEAKRMVPGHVIRIRKDSTR